jgi:succinate dehydrogenase flavin-adding protein (antitoxin of CptAB toxin-antitoxin module)
MPADPFLHISPADERIIQQARRRGPRALKKVTEALARKAIDLANKKDKKREKELLDSEDRVWPPAFLASKGKPK